MECLHDVFTFQGDIRAIIKVQVTKGNFGHNTVGVFFVMSLFESRVSILILLNVNLLCYKLFLLNDGKRMGKPELAH